MKIDVKINVLAALEKQHPISCNNFNFSFDFFNDEEEEIMKVWGLSSSYHTVPSAIKAFVLRVSFICSSYFTSFF